MKAIEVGLAAGLLVGAVTAAAADEKTDRGRTAFTAQKCTLCHSIEGRGNKKGALDGVGSKLTAAQIRDWIVDPEGMAARTTPPPARKPPMKKRAMPAEEVDALVALLSGLK